MQHFEVARHRAPVCWSTFALICALGALSTPGCSSTDNGTAASGNDAGASAAGSGGSAGSTAGSGGGGAGPADAGPPLVEGTCEIDPNAVPKFVQKLACTADFEALASEPLDDSIPGARSGKVVLDRFDGQLYFQNTNVYKIHYEFASAQLSGGDRPMVTTLSAFNETEYFVPERRFVLGSVTYYTGPKTWTLELAPYDTASPALVEELWNAVKAASFFGPQLVFHPTSEAVATTAASLPDTIPIRTTDDLYEGIDYQPLNLGETVGRLRFVQSATLAGTYLGFRDVVVLDKVPNDISVVAGLITQDFQTPLSHVNVLAQNRGTPNMGLRNASTNEQLKALDGKWVKLVVGAFEWSIAEVTQADADAYWEANKPTKVVLPELDLSVTELQDIETITEHVEGKKVTRDAISKSVRAFGAKAANYSVLMHIENVPIKKGFAIPVFYYRQFMEENGFDARVQGLLADAKFKEDPAEREAQLKALRDAIKAAPLNADFAAKLKTKLDADYPGETMRFRSSTNAEDLAGFPCAGCYDSHTGDPADWEGDMLYAIKQTWATVWSFRTFEEREYQSIDHLTVAMALLVHHNFPDEEANGVAVTANPYDPTGNAPGFYVNVQFGGEAEVVAPPEGVTSDSFIYQYSYPNSPIIYLTHSNLVAEGATVLTVRQIRDLGTALEAIHNAFSDAYGPGSGNTGWYAMDVEFKFDDEADTSMAPALYIKQARPYPGRGRGNNAQ
jgi:pyruvate, water dikinase